MHQLAYLTVLEPPNIDDSVTPSQRQVREHEPAVLECSAIGYPAPNITWRREDGVIDVDHASIPLLNPADKKMERKKKCLAGFLDSCRSSSNEVLPSWMRKNNIGRGRLCIPSASRNSMGIYVCIASNGLPPSVSKRIHLAVLCESFESFKFISFADHRLIHWQPVPPTVRAESSIVGSFVGSPHVGLECNVEASPQTGHFWQKGSKSSSNSKRNLFFRFTVELFEIDHTIGMMKRYTTKVKNVNAYTVKMILVIQDVEEDDAGLYRCRTGDGYQASIRLYGKIKRKTIQNKKVTDESFPTVNPAPIQPSPATFPPSPSSRKKQNRIITSTTTKSSSTAGFMVPTNRPMTHSGNLSHPRMVMMVNRSADRIHRHQRFVWHMLSLLLFGSLIH